MASAKKYFPIDKSKLSYYVTHLFMKDYFNKMLFTEDETTRVFIASNAYALRDRSDSVAGSQSNLDYPFMNFKRTAWENDFQRRSRRGYYNGVYIDEVGTKIKYNPVIFSFEGTIWTNTESDMVEFQRRISWDSNNTTEFDVLLTIKNTQIPLTVYLNYNNYDFDPQYNEQDWLNQDKIHTIGLTFTVTTFDIEVNEPSSVEKDKNPRLYSGDSFSETEEVIYEYSVKTLNGTISGKETISIPFSELPPN